VASSSVVRAPLAIAGECEIRWPPCRELLTTTTLMTRRQRVIAPAGAAHATVEICSSTWGVE